MTSPTTRRAVLGWLAGLTAATWLPGRASASAEAEAVPVTALRGVTLIDTAGAPPRRNATIVLADNRIVAVGHRDLPLPPGATVFDLPGKFVIPGLWDMHVHGAYLERVTLPLCLVNGVVGIREMWGSPPIYDLRRRIESGQVFGPRLLVGSAIIDGPHSTLPFALVVSTPEQARQAVRDAVAGGADFVKVYPFLDRPLLTAIASECRALGISFVGHASDHVSVGESSDLGQRTFEHMYGFPLATSTRERSLREAIAALPLDPADSWSWFKQVRELERQAALTHSHAKTLGLAKRLHRNGSWQSPTIVTMRVLGSPADRFVDDPRMRYLPPSYKDFWTATLQRWCPVTPQEVRDQEAFLRHRMHQVAELHRLGVGTLLGTDAGNPYTFPGFSVHDELELLVRAGLSPLDALRTGTRDVARFLGERGGTLEPGSTADLVVLDGNPLADVRNTRRVHTVLTKGRVIGPDDRVRMLAEVERAAQEPFPAMRACC